MVIFLVCIVDFSKYVYFSCMYFVKSIILVIKQVLLLDLSGENG